GLARQRGLALGAARSGNARGARHEPELPQERPTRRAEAVACARGDERLQAALVDRRALGEVTNVAVRPAPLALLDERRGVVLPHGRDVFEPDPNGYVLESRLRRASVHLRRADLHPAPLRV